MTNFLSGSDKGVFVTGFYHATFFSFKFKPFIFSLFMLFDHVLVRQNPVRPRLRAPSGPTRRADIKQTSRESRVSEISTPFLSALCLLEKTLNTCLSVTHPFPRALVPKCLSWD